MDIKAAVATCKYDMFRPIAANIWCISNLQIFHQNIRLILHTWKP
jgi:hypothetical protein